MNFYIHIPFCKSKCKYCHFASFPGVESILKEKYLEKLKKEISDFFEKSGNQKIDTIYFGGGTPSILGIEEIKEILDIFKQISNNEQNKLLDFSHSFEMTKGSSKLQNPEITLEVNPEFVTKEYVEGLKSLGINRLSLGVQTLQEKSLEEIGRCSKKTIFNALQILQELEFTNVGIDFIIGLPFVSKGKIKEDIEKLLSKFDIIKHISVYMLEDGKYPENWKNISLKDEDFVIEYNSIVEFLEIKGFIKYEISNFAKSNFECRHNKGYWNHTNYRGFGLSAASYIDGERFANSSNFDFYYKNILEYSEKLSSEDILLEKIMFDFRTIGVDKKLVKNEEKLKEFIVLKLLKKEKNIIRLTNKGTLLVDYIIREIFL